MFIKFRLFHEYHTTILPTLYCVFVYYLGGFKHVFLFLLAVPIFYLRTFPLDELFLIRVVLLG